MENIILYHASKQIVENPEVRVTRYEKDFSWGFYCTKDLSQAVRWANRGMGEPIVNKYEYTPNDDLNVLVFEKMTDEWLDFIAACRNGGSHSYDIVEGPMADDTVWNYVNDYMNGSMTREQFWVMAAFKHPTHQISFHTPSALKCLRYTGNEAIYDSEEKR